MQWLTSLLVPPRRGCARLSVFGAAIAGIVAVGAFAPVADACGCRKPPIRACSPGFGFVKFAPRVFPPVPAMPVTYCVRPVVNPPCPAGVICIPCAPIANVTVTMTVFNAAGVPVGGGTVVLTPPTVADGARTCGAVNVTPTAGGLWPIGIYTVRGVADLTLTDGTVIRRRGDTCFAVVDETSPGSGIPVIDIENTTPVGPGGTDVHPGDTQTNTYRFVNNRNVPVTLNLNGQNVQNARIPEVVAGSAEPFSFAAPLSGDHFPIKFADNVLDPCLPMPLGDPAALPIQEDNLCITLLAGEVRDVEVLSRGFPLCQSGSACEQVVFVDATWTDGVSATLCVAGITTNDSGVPPAFDCPKGGSLVEWTGFTDPLKGFAILNGQAQPTAIPPFPVQYQFFPPNFLAGPPDLQQPLIPEQIVFDTDGLDTCRIIYQIPLPQLPPEELFWDAQIPLQIQSPLPLIDVLGGVNPNIPELFEATNPTGKMHFLFDAGGTAVADVSNLLQVHVELVSLSLAGDPGVQLPMDFAFFDPQPLNPSQIDLAFGGLLPPVPLPDPALLVTVNVRSYAGCLAPPFCSAADLNSDGVLNNTDINLFVSAFLAQNGVADLNNDCNFNNTDINLFVSLFLAGCE